MTYARRLTLAAALVWPLLAMRVRVDPVATADASGQGRGVQEGVASWYGMAHDGRLMANGRRFHALGISAAHRLLPLGTRVRVHNVEAGRMIEIEITDRGPYVAGRILDVSLGAARMLQMEHAGLAWVRIEVI